MGSLPPSAPCQPSRGPWPTGCPTGGPRVRALLCKVVEACVWEAASFYLERGYKTISLQTGLALGSLPPLAWGPGSTV